MTDKIRRARACYREGRLDEARLLCRQALRAQPRNFDALTLLGILAAQADDPQQALELFRKAVLANPRSAVAYNNQANALRDLKAPEAAVASLDKAIALDPQYAQAYNNRGNALRDLRQHQAALASYDQAIALDPSCADACSNRGHVLCDLRRFEAAIDDYARAIALNPRLATAYNGRGSALRALGRYEAACADFDSAIALKPDYAQAHNNRGLALSDLKRHEAAIASYGNAIALMPEYADAHYNKGNALAGLERYEAAIASYDRAIAFDANSAQSHNNRGNALRELQNHPAAVASYERAITIQPDYADAHYNLGNVLRELQNHAASVASYARAVALKPDFKFVDGMRRNGRMHLCDWDDFEPDVTRLAARIERDEPASDPFSVLALLDSAALQMQAARAWAREMCPPSAQLPAIPQRAGHDRIRVGYFSADFRNHPLAALTAELFETHDRTRFELTAFSFGPDTRDEMRLRIEKAFERFLDVKDKSYRDIVQLARSLEIDIAVDLGGFTQGARPRIFAMRAAPLQLSYLGYLGTMSVEYMDYLIADATIVPPASRKHYCEKIVYLPSYQANDSSRPIAPKRFTREELGLPPAGFVFCCFNTSYKITPAAFTRWMRILARVPDSVLLLLGDGGTVESNLRKEALRRGIDAGRLVFGARLPMPEYLARYRAADLFLDTLPYNAGTTASDALWAGLPVLTCMGEAFASRVAASLLQSIELAELITSTEEEYENLAVELATDLRRLADIRGRLEANRLTTSLFDTRSFTRHLEAAYSKIHARHQAGLPPGHMHVEPIASPA